MASAQRGIQSVEIGGALLLVLARSRTSMPLRDLAKAAGMTPSKAHPYLVSFSKLGLIFQDPQISARQHCRSAWPPSRGCLRCALHRKN